MHDRSSAHLHDRSSAHLHDDWGVRAPRWAGIASTELDVRGTRVHALRGGTDVDGIPHLLLHGLGGTATNWMEVLPALAATGPVVAPDLPGFGRTRPARGHRGDVHGTAEFLVELLDVLGWDQVVVHGNSMGGLLAVLLADLDRDRTRGLVLAAPALPLPRSRWHQGRPGALATLLPAAVPVLGGLGVRLVTGLAPPELASRRTARFVHHDPDRLSPEARRLVVDDLTAGRTSGWTSGWRSTALATATRSILRTLVTGGGVAAALDRCEVPGLVIWGDRDRLIARGVVDHALERCPDWERHELADVGHIPMLEAPDEYVRAVEGWVTRHRTSLALATAA